MHGALGCSNNTSSTMQLGQNPANLASTSIFSALQQTPMKKALPTAALLKAFQQLDVSEQNILKVLSVIYIAVGQTQLKNTLAHLGWKTAHGDALGGIINGKLKQQWLEAGLVISKSNKIKCAPQIEEILTRQVVEQGLYKEINNAAISAITEIRFLNNFAYYPDQYTARRNLRSALHLNDIPELLHELSAQDPFESLNPALTNRLVTLCNNAFDLAWFSQRDLAIQYQVMACHLHHGSIDHLPYVEQYYDYLETLFEQDKLQHPKLIGLLVEQRLIRGNSQNIEDLLGVLEPEQQQNLLAWQHFLQGNMPQVIHHYKLGLKALRKRCKKRTLYMQGLSSLFYALALIKSGTSADKKEALKCLKYLISVSYNEQGITLAAEVIIDIVLVLDNKRAFSQCYHLARDADFSQSPLFCLFQTLGYHWLGESVSDKQIAQLEKHAHLAQENNGDWFANESAALLEQLTNSPAHKKKKQLCVASLVNLIEPTSAWQIALTALQEVTQDNSEKTAPNNRDTRLVWLVEEEPFSELFELTPRLQTRSKNGKWTKGRAVALSRLRHELDTMDFIIEADKAICQTIIEEPGYGYYAKPQFSMDQEQCFIAAIDHPHIYWMNQPEVQVEIQQSEPELMVIKQKTNISIQLSPSPNLREVYEGLNHHVLIQKETAGRLRITQFNRQQLQIFSILGPQGLTVPAKGKAAVLNSMGAIAPLLTIHSDIGGGNDSNIDLIAGDPRLQLQLQAMGEGLKIECFIQPFANGGPLFHPNEGGTSVFAEIDGKRLQAKRDLEQEAANYSQLISQCPVLEPGQHEWTLNDPELALEVLLELQALQESEPDKEQAILVLSWPKGKKISLLKEISKEQFHISVGKKRDWFELGGELKLEDGAVIAMQEVITLMAQSPGRFLRLESGDVVALTRDLQKRLNALQRFSDEGQFHPLASHAIDELTDGMQVKKNKLWQQQIARIKQAQSLQPEVPSTLQAQLRDYQIEGFNWLARLAHWGAGACLADDMGLGKTVQALALILTRAPQGPTLVLAPTSVCINWMEEIVKFSPTLKPRFIGAISGTQKRQQCLDDAGPFDVIVCTYGLLQSEVQALSNKQWHSIVADEAQAIKNPLTKRSKAAMALQGDFKMVTTGTPIENHLGELWNLFRFINPGLLGSQSQFKQCYSTPIENDNDSQTKDHLKKLIRPFILRRVKSEVLKELPSRTEITLRVPPSNEEAVMYEALRRQALERLAESSESSGQQHIKVLAEITRLRLACCNPELAIPGTDIQSEKLKAFSAVLDELLQNKHKALVFSQFVSHLSLIRQHLDDKGISYQYLDGSTPSNKRKQAVNDFQSGKGEVFLISLKAGGAGLNLTAADYVLHMDPWWNPAVEDQASDRAHRMGQQRPVTIYRFVMKGTIEDRIVDLHQHKRDLANSLLEGTEMSGKMSVDAMLNLINEE